MSRAAEVFEVLSRGGFICSNAVRPGGRDLYRYAEENEEHLAGVFAEVGYQLETGNNYYYFSRPGEDSQSRERKITKALRWLDTLAFFTTYRKDLCRGARITPHEITAQLEINNSLKDQLAGLRRGGAEKNHTEQIDALFAELRREGFIELENETTQTWKLLDAWDYMEQLVMAVNISDEREEG